MNKNLDVIVSFEEIEKEFGRQLESFAVIKDAAKVVFGSSSLIVSLIGVSQVFSSNNFNGSKVIQWFLIVLTSVLYFSLAKNSMEAVSPTRFHGPLEAEIKTYQAAFFKKNEREIYKSRIVQYIASIRKNLPALEEKHKHLEKAQRALVLLVTILLLMGAMQTM